MDPSDPEFWSLSVSKVLRAASKSSKKLAAEHRIPDPKPVRTRRGAARNA